MNTQTVNEGARGSKKYQERLEQIRKYAASQGIALDSPRVRKYAVTQGIDPSDLGVEVVESNQAQTDEAVKRYAEKMGLKPSDPQVRKYANAGAEEEAGIIDIEGSDDTRFKEAVLHYANSQSLELSAPQVQKYARGLLGSQGDFSEDNKPVETPESAERRFNEAVQRYAEAIGQDVDSPQVTKYANGLRKTNVIPAPRRSSNREEHAHQ